MDFGKLLSAVPRQDRQVIISPLGILGVIAVCICKPGQMAHAPADTPVREKWEAEDYEFSDC